MMKNFYLTFLSIMLMAEIHSGASKDPLLKCYSCNSNGNPDCVERDRNKLKAFETDCNADNTLSIDDLPGMKLPNLTSSLDLDKGYENEQTVCLMAEYTENDSKKKVVMRFCSIEQNDKNSCKSKILKNMKDVSDITCIQCDTDLCNDATITAPSLLLFVTSLSYIIVFKQ